MVRASSSPNSHRNDIDGLRAIAVLLVVLFHANLGVSGGYVGVDVFFVLSGYLITGAILREQDAGTFTLTGFWMRRLRRILPAATCMVAICLLVGIVALQANDLKQLAESAFAQQLIYSNVYFLRTGGYFDGPAELKPLLHTWSLSVEEQFYLLFPFLVMAIKRWSNSMKLSVISGLLLISLGSCEFFLGSNPDLCLFLLPMRAWELLIGAALALIRPAQHLSPRNANILAASGLLGIFGSAMCYSATTRFPGFSALIPTGGAALFIYANSSALTTVARPLTCQPLRIVALTSYSIYLWHWPLLVFPRLILGYELPVAARLGAVIASFIVGYVSWALVEEPIRRGKALCTNRRVVGATFTSLACLLMVAVWIRVGDGLPTRLPASVAALGDVHLAKPTILPSGTELPEGVYVIGSVGQYSRVKFLLWGDSHAHQISQLCEKLASERGIQGFFASRNAVPPLAGVHSGNPYWTKPQQLAWNRSVLDLVARERVGDVLLASRWERKIHGDERNPNSLEGFLSDEATVKPHLKDAVRVLKSGLEETVTELGNAGATVWFLMQVPKQDGSPTRKIINSALLCRVAGLQFTDDFYAFPRGVSQTAYEQQQLEILTLSQAAHSPILNFVGPGNTWFDSNGYSRICDGTSSLYYDDNHLSVQGADAYFRSLLEPIFDRMVQSESERPPMISDGGETKRY